MLYKQLLVYDKFKICFWNSLPPNALDLLLVESADGESMDMESQLSNSSF